MRILLQSLFFFCLIALGGGADDVKFFAEEKKDLPKTDSAEIKKEETAIEKTELTNRNTKTENKSVLTAEKISEEFLPLADHPSLLKRLDRTEPIWVASDRSELVLGGFVCLREGLLEFFACRERSKEHESIIALKIKPHLIHAGLLIIGARQGSPARFDPKVIPPMGEEIDIRVRWLDDKGVRQEVRAQEWVLESNSKKIMTSPWVFTGGLFGKDSKGKRYYLADVSGEVFGVANFPGSILDVPFVSSSNNDELFYQPNTPKIPAIGTPVTLILKTTGKFYSNDKEK